MVIINNDFLKTGNFILIIILLVFFIVSLISDFGMGGVDPGPGLKQLEETGNRAINEYDNITQNTMSKIENSSGIAQTITFIPGIVIDSMRLLKNIMLLVKDYIVIIATNLGVPPIILTIISIMLILITIVYFLRAIGGNL